MPTYTPIRFPKRSIHVQQLGAESIESRLRLPALMPVLPLPRRPRQRKRRKGIPHTVAGLLRTVITAVNVRGMCAAHAARVADLPQGEVRDIQALCRCSACLKLRVH